jgi:hypothetical protein
MKIFLYCPSPIEGWLNTVGELGKDEHMNFMLSKGGKPVESIIVLYFIKDTQSYAAPLMDGNHDPERVALWSVSQ